MLWKIGAADRQTPPVSAGVAVGRSAEEPLRHPIHPCRFADLKMAKWRHYCPRQPGIRRFGAAKSFILSTAPISLGGGLRGRHDPVQNGSEADVGRQNASSSTQNGYLRACRESFRPPTSGHRVASPVQKGGRQKLFWTRVSCNSISETC